MPTLLLDLIRYNFKFEESVSPKKHQKKSKKKNKKELVQSGLIPPTETSNSVDSTPILSTSSNRKGYDDTPIGDQQAPSLVEPLRSDLPALSAPLADVSKGPMLNLRKEIHDELMTHGISIKAQDDESTIHPAFRPRTHGKLHTLALDNDLAELEKELHAPNPDDLCTFCNKVLPKNPSKMLLDLGNYLKGRRDVCKRYSLINPNALHLPPITAAAIRMRLLLSQQAWKEAGPRKLISLIFRSA
ncbi:hypothetical protein PTTG_28588 [Puccinia triticina 1-1 BBBD Race 1]|uniref:Uncharacterized protein n=1 Tax=Puccinia triticina (isolate 1-1 / race 1 (BBBD)) TaxID=630390 RepID=A0A180GCQ2_PUCT1|nr:hypothetical protein PTTG_28588 [Puccinia triticina 1-1 BBBD Race 1]